MNQQTRENQELRDRLARAGEGRADRFYTSGGQVRERQMRASKQRRVLSALIRPALWFCACNLLAAAMAAQCTNPTQVPNGAYTSGDHSQVDNNALVGVQFRRQQGATATFGQATASIWHRLSRERYRRNGPDHIPCLGGYRTNCNIGLPSSPPQNPPLTQSFTWTVSSPAGQSNLSHVFALFNTTSSTANACYIHYDASSNLVYLADNASSTWLGGFAPSSSGSIGNSQCTIAGSNYFAKSHKFWHTTRLDTECHF